MADPKPSSNGLHALSRTLKTTGARMRELEKADGTQLADLVQRVDDALENLNAQVQAAIAANSYTSSQIDSKLGGKSDTGHKHDGADVTSGTVARPVSSPSTIASTGAASIGGTATIAGRLTANTGMTSTGVRNNQVTTGYVAMYVDQNGVYGYAPSTLSTKTLLRNFQVDLEKWLTLIPKVFAYKDDAAKTEQFGMIAELVVKREPMLGIYDETRKLRGVRYELLGVVCLALIQAHVAETRAFRDDVDRRLSALEN